MILRISRSLSGAGAGSARAMPATTTLLSVSLRGVSPASSSPQDRRGARQSGMKPTDWRRHRSAQPRRARAVRRASLDPPPRVLGLADQVWLHPVGMGELAHRTTRSRPQPTSARPDIVGFGYTDSPDDFTYDRDNRVTCSASSTPTTCRRSPSSAGTDSVVRGVDVVLEDEAGDRHQQKRTRYHQQPDVEERQ